MVFKNAVLKLLILLLCVVAPMAGAELSEKHTAIIEANERTQSYISEKNYEGALRSAKAAYELSLQTLGESDPNTANLAVVYARLLAPTGDRQKAFDYYRRAVEIFENVYGKNNIQSVPALLGLAEFAPIDKQVDQVRIALALQLKHEPDNKLKYADGVFYAGEYLVRYSQNREYAAEILTRALAICEKEYGEDSSSLIQPLLLLGNASTKWADSREAKKYYRRALKIAQKKLTEEQHALVLRQAGAALLQYTGSGDARKYLSRSHRMFLELFGEDDSRTALSALALARFHMSSNKFVWAEPLLKQALSVVEKDPNYRNHQMSILSLLVETYELRGRRDEATPYCQAIGAISPWTDTQNYKPIFKKNPVYPADARQSGLPGYVIIEYTVDENGFVQQPRIIDSAGPESLLAASLDAVDGYRYAPAFSNGEPVATAGVRNKFTYKLAD